MNAPKMSSIIPGGTMTHMTEDHKAGSPEDRGRTSFESWKKRAADPESYIQRKEASEMQVKWRPAQVKEK